MPPVTVSVKVNDQDMRRITARLHKVSNPSKFQAIVERGVRRGLKHVRKSIEASIDKRVYGRDTGFPNRPRTGRLRKFRTFPKVEGKDVLGMVQSDAPHALAHEKGATIRPVSAKALTVPISPFAVGRRAGDFQGTFARKDTLFGMIAGDAVPLFALKQSVRIKKKQPFEMGAKEAINEYIKEVRKTIEANV